MSKKRYHVQWNSQLECRDDENISQRYFWWPFRKKKKEKFEGRTGAMEPQKIKKTIEGIGIGKQIEILRIGYDGSIDDIPINVEIIDISPNSFTGKIINLERRMIESATDKLVYAKTGGGVLEFNYNDGDIKEIALSHDQELIEQERNIDNLIEVLSALEAGDHVIVAYYDNQQKGTINTEGVITEKSDTDDIFTLTIEKINRIELQRKITKKFDLQKDLVIDIELV
jgi:hypothetical protein